MAVAVVYWGLTRSARLVAHTHVTNLYVPLEKAGYKVDRFIHTWTTSSPMVWGKPDAPVDPSAIEVFSPIASRIDSQEEFLQGIQFSDYFDHALWAATGEYGGKEWRPELVRNHLCALESLRRAFQLVHLAKYTYIIFLRPDMEILQPFPVQSLQNLPSRGILLTDQAHGEGFNDRFAVMHAETASTYANRIEGLKEFRRTRGRIVSEKIVKAIIETSHLIPVFIEWPLCRVRSDGTRLAT